MRPPEPARSSLWRLPGGEAARLARFAAVGVLNTLFGYGVFYLLLVAGLQPVPALALATIVGIVFNFFSTATLVFRRPDLSRLGRFTGIYAITFTVNAIALAVAVDNGVAPATAQAILVVPMALLAYVLNSRLVFGEK